ncbi:MAG TPA: sigma 54-interacting transcriptional regulator [Syntrophomonadaceae bacterium]|nr:sigma 54-interacting transcriptional regulator [Syntrophomonadaceae bacterium]
MEASWLASDLWMENPTICAMLVDQTGRVVFINNTYLGILGKSEDDLVGSYIGDITPDTRTLIVIRTGKAIVGYNWFINGYKMIASALPVIKNGSIVGCFAYSLFMDIWDAKNLAENLMFELNMYKDEVRNFYSARYSFRDIIGDAQPIQNVKFLAQQAALHATTTVLITGESGTGKELFAQAIHNCSKRSSFPFVRVNCAAIPENLLEAELFGYVEGAFTGARKGGSPGKFELANGGTVFLDEIGEMSLAMQGKLLVVLQEREFERLGSHQPIRVNVRVIAATNRDLEGMVEEHRFREDLYYRLNVLRLEVPPLRARTEDIPSLVKNLVPRLNANLGTSVHGASDRALDLMRKYGWPGNIRELENILERAMILADMERSNSIMSKHLAFMKCKMDYQCAPSSGSLKKVMDDYEKHFIAKVMEENGYDKLQASRALDIDVSWLYKKLKKYGIPSNPR